MSCPCWHTIFVSVLSRAHVIPCDWLWQPLSRPTKTCFNATCTAPSYVLQPVLLRTLADTVLIVYCIENAWVWSVFHAHFLRCSRSARPGEHQFNYRWHLSFTCQKKFFRSVLSQRCTGSAQSWNTEAVLKDFIIRDVCETCSAQNANVNNSFRWVCHVAFQWNVWKDWHLRVVWACG